MQMIVLKVLHEGEATELFPERVRCAVPVTLSYDRYRPSRSIYSADRKRLCQPLLSYTRFGEGD